MSNMFRLMMPLVLAGIVVSAAHAAEPAGQLSKEATQAGPAVNTSAAPAPAEETSVDAGPAVQTSPAAAPGRKPATTGPQAVVRNDRLNLDTTVVTGNRELPKVLYIVPWKKSDIGNLPAQPFNTLLDEALTPVDRDVFRREVTYYGAVSEAAAAASPQAGGSEK